jgi:hypothetical protein
MSAAHALHRTPLVISAGQLVAGPVNATYREGDRESLLHNYLVLIRQIRGEQREPTITLRGADISALAEHLGASEERVLDDLLGRMGATRAQRKALLAMFAAGVLTIVATGSIALDLAPAGVLAQGSTAEGVVGVVDVPVVQVAPVTVAAPTSTPAAQAAAPTEVPTVSADVPEPELALAIGGADWEYTLSLHQLAAALAEPLADDEPTAGIGVADDGSVVGVGQAPLPMPEGVGVADDGSVVGVGQPPLPMPEGVGVADDGSVVGVGQPPLP